MQIVLVTADTRGGVQPYLALGLGLQRAGHRVRVVTPENFVGWVGSHGLEPWPLGGDVQTVLAGAGGQVGGRAAIAVSMRELGPRAAEWARQVTRAGTGADLMVGGVGGMVAGTAAADHLGVRFVPAHLQPVSAPTARYPGVLTGALPDWAGPPGRYASHLISAAGLWGPFAPARRRARAALRAPRQHRPRRPILYGLSRHVVPVPEAPHRHVTGYWTLEDDSWTPPRQLKAFLEAPDPRPVVSVGFGSMPTSDPHQLTALLRQAAATAGVRVVLLSGWSEHTAPDQHDPDMIVLSAAPHDWLYPRVAAAVHHGGAGTTAASLRAGIPTVVVPFAVDQPFWGQRVHALGAGPQPLPHHRLTPARLAQGLRVATTDSTMRDAAEHLGHLIRAEDGIAAAINALESNTR